MIGGEGRGVVFAPPEGWVAARVREPALGSSELAMDEWRAWRSPEDAGTLVVSACVGTDLGAWTSEATPIALERLDAIVGATLADQGAPVALGVRREDRNGVVVEQTLVGVGNLADRAVARTFLGFTTDSERPRLRGCFVLCTSTSHPCETALSRATAGASFGPPPRASAPLRAIAYGLHHSRAVAACSVSVLFLAGVVAVWTRPRPRRK